MRSQLSCNAAMVMGCLLCIAIACAGQAAKTAAIHYSGRVVDESTGKPIESALIRVIPSNHEAAWRSDSQGGFSFWTGRRKNAKIEIEHEGYQIICLSPQSGSLPEVRIKPEKISALNRTGLSTSGVFYEVLAPSQSIAPAIVTADSQPKLSGSGNHWSHWYRLEVDRAPQGYTIQKVEFWLTGDHACGLSAQCQEIERTDHQIVWKFRLRGHREIGAPPATKSTAHIRAFYRAR